MPAGNNALTARLVCGGGEEKTLCKRNSRMKKAVEEDNNVNDENVVEPDVLYKYCMFNEYTEKIFTHNEIYFSTPDEFNDPFDSKPRHICEGKEKQIESYFYEHYRKKCPDRSEEEILSHVKKFVRDRSALQKVLEESIERLRKKLGICCFSEKRDNILMWAHYANQHTGFCLEFDIDNDFFRPITCAIKVEYDAILPVLNILELGNYPRKELGRKLLTKANDWEYEQEWRIVDHKKGPGIQNFPEDALSGVILGCRISEENKENVFRWCMKRKHPPTLYEAREKQREFGLDIVTIDY